MIVVIFSLFASMVSMCLQSCHLLLLI